MAQPKGPVMDFKQVNDDLYINPVTGDWEMVPSDNQHITDILRSAPGDWKNSLGTGANLDILLKGKVDVQKVEATAKSQLESDNYQVGRPQVINNPNGQTIIKPNAERLQ